MPLQAWLSNRKKFSEEFNVTVNSIQSVLGLKWDSSNDTLSLAESKVFPVNVTPELLSCY